MFKKTFITTGLLLVLMIILSGSARAQEYDSFGYYSPYNQNYYPPQEYVDYGYQPMTQPNYYDQGDYYQPQQNYSSPASRAVRYGALGAVIGALGSSHNHGTNALKGAGIGAAAGLLLGR